MPEIVNLRRARKARAHAAADQQAAANRLRHGRTLAERAAADLLAARQQRELAGHRLEGGEAAPQPPAPASAQAGAANRAKDRASSS